MSDANKDSRGTVAELRALLEKATPGPVYLCETWPGAKFGKTIVSFKPDGSGCAGSDFVQHGAEADAALHVALRNAAPKLLAVVEAANAYYEKRGQFMSDGENHALGMALLALGDAS